MTGHGPSNGTEPSFVCGWPTSGSKNSAAHSSSRPEGEGPNVSMDGADGSTTAPGHSGRVLRVSDRDPELLQALEDAGVAVGVELTASADGIRVDGTATALPDGAVEAIWLTA